MKLITKNLQWIVFVFLVFQIAASAQIKVGNNPTIINPSAIMEIESANEGFLLPRLPLTDVSLPAPLSEHVAGMIIYNTATAIGVVPGFYYNDGTKWVGVSQSTTTGLLSADNGLTNVTGVAKLGGSLTQPTVLSTTSINTIAINGLIAGDILQGDFVIIDKVTGILKTIPYSVIETAINKKVDSNPLITAGTNTKITYDEKGLVTKGENVVLQDIQGLQMELDKKAPTDSPVFTGAPQTAPINASSSPDAIATKSYVDNAVNGPITSVVSQTITDGQTTTAPSEDAVYDALIKKADVTYVDGQDALKAPIDSPTFTGVAKAVTPIATSDVKTIATKEYVDAAVLQAPTNVVSQTILLNNTTTAPSEDVVRKELDLKADKTYVDAQDALKAPIDSPTFTGVAKAVTPIPTSDIKTITTKEYVDAAVLQGQTNVVSQTILLNNTTTAPSEDAVRKELDLKVDKTYVDAQDALKAPIDSPTFTGVAKAVTPIPTSDIKTITTKEYVDAAVLQGQTNVVSQTILLNNTTTAPSEDAVRKELDLKADKTYVDVQDALKAPVDSPTFTGVAKAVTPIPTSDIKTITTKEYVDAAVLQGQTNVVSQTILLNNTTTAPSEDAVRKELDLKADKTYVDVQDALKAPVDSPTFTGVAKAVTPIPTSDIKTITTKEYVDAAVLQGQTNVVSQTILLNNTTTAPSEDAVRKE